MYNARILILSILFALLLWPGFNAAYAQNAQQLAVILSNSCYKDRMSCSQGFGCQPDYWKITRNGDTRSYRFTNINPSNPSVLRTHGFQDNGCQPFRHYEHCLCGDRRGELLCLRELVNYGNNHRYRYADILDTQNDVIVAGEIAVGISICQ